MAILRYVYFAQWLRWGTLDKPVSFLRCPPRSLSQTALLQQGSSRLSAQLLFVMILRRVELSTRSFTDVSLSGTTAFEPSSMVLSVVYQPRHASPTMPFGACQRHLSV